VLKRFLKEGLIFPLAFAAYKGKPLVGMGRYVTVLREFFRYRDMVRQQNTGERLAFRDFYPWLVDRDAQAGKVDGYLYQDTWCARKIATSKPKVHVDVGSTLLAMAVIAQYSEVIAVDVRPLSIHLPGLTFRPGTLLNLPFESNSVESLSSLNVVEHVGLGRYGDPLDPRGTDRACEELMRVLRPGGALYMATPTQKQPSTYFNAHRIFNPDDFISKFRALSLVEECYATENGMLDRHQYQGAGMPFAYGCFHLAKP